MSTIIHAAFVLLQLAIGDARYSHDETTVRASYALALTTTNTVATAEGLCDAEWEPQSDGWWSCYVGLESWRCEVRGWCEGWTSTVALMPLPDPVWAGQQEWD